MSTTLIFAEFLSIGALTLIAIALMAVGLGLEPTALLALIGNGPAVGATLALAMAYPLGITVDGCADRLFRDVGSSKERTELGEDQTVFSLAFDKARWCDFAAKYFEYNRIKTRLARSFILNSIFMAMAGAVAGLRMRVGGDFVVIWVILWSLLAAGAWWTLYELRGSARRKLAEAWRATRISSAKEAQATPGRQGCSFSDSTERGRSLATGVMEPGSLIRRDSPTD